MMAVLLVELVFYAGQIGNGAPQRTLPSRYSRAIDDGRGYAEARGYRALPLAAGS